MGDKRFVINNKKREITNNYEIKSILNSFCKDFPEYSQFIYSNIRNYIIKKSSCMIISKDQGHEFYQKYFKISDLNPEINIIENKGKNEFHHLLISSNLTSQLNNLLIFFKMNNIKAKASFHIEPFILKSEKWFRLKNFEQLSLEGEIEFVLKGLRNSFWVCLKDKQAFHRESLMMSNCVKSFYGSYLAGHCQIFSLRDEKNIPLVTIEVKNNYILQAKEKYNKLSNKYNDELDFFIKHFKLEKRTNFNLDSIDLNYNIINNLPYGVSFENDDEKESFIKKTIRLVSIFFNKFFF